MPRHAVSNDGPIEDVVCRKQRRRGVAFIVVRHGFTVPPHQRKAFLRSVESLYLALLVHAQHSRVFRGIRIQAHHKLASLSKRAGPLPVRPRHFHHLDLPHVRWTRGRSKAAPSLERSRNRRMSHGSAFFCARETGFGTLFTMLIGMFTALLGTGIARSCA